MSLKKHLTSKARLTIIFFFSFCFFFLLLVNSPGAQYESRMILMSYRAVLLFSKVFQFDPRLSKSEQVSC